MSPAAGYIAQTFVTLAVVCGLAVVVLWAARRAGVGRSDGPIALVGRLPLETRRSIYLVKVGEQVLVIGAGDGGFTKLGEIPAGALAQSPTAREERDPLREVLSQGVQPPTRETQSGG